MSVETRGREAAAALRAATRVDTESGLADLRRRYRRRNAGRLVVAAAAAAGVVGLGLVVADGPVTEPRPVDEKPTETTSGNRDALCEASVRAAAIRRLGTSPDTLVTDRRGEGTRYGYLTSDGGRFVWGCFMASRDSTGQPSVYLHKDGSETPNP
jgi:hypothetical protein